MDCSSQLILYQTSDYNKVVPNKICPSFKVQWTPAYENEICTWLVLTNKQQIERKKKSKDKYLHSSRQFALDIKKSWPTQAIHKTKQKLLIFGLCTTEKSVENKYIKCIYIVEVNLNYDIQIGWNMKANINIKQNSFCNTIFKEPYPENKISNVSFNVLMEYHQ